MSITYQELFDEVPTIRLKNTHPEDINNHIIIEPDVETGQWTCCWKVHPPLNGCEAAIIPVAFITQIARLAPVPLNTAAVLHCDHDTERMTLSFGWSEKSLD